MVQGGVLRTTVVLSGEDEVVLEHAAGIEREPDRGVIRLADDHPTVWIRASRLRDKSHIIGKTATHT